MLIKEVVMKKVIAEEMSIEKEIEVENNTITEKEDILDYMSSTELAANLFRITQTDEVLKNKKIKHEDDACNTHHDVGQAVRQTIKKIGGTMPEDLPTPNKSAKQIERERKIARIQ